MSEEDVNIGNPANNPHDQEERNAPPVTPFPAEPEADDLFDDGGKLLGRGSGVFTRSAIPLDPGIGYA